MTETNRAGEQLYKDHLDLIERTIRVVSRNEMGAEEIEDFASWAKLRLMNDDYAILRKFNGRASLTTYLIIVIRRLLSDYQNHPGRWHASAAYDLDAKPAMLADSIDAGIIDADRIGDIRAMHEERAFALAVEQVRDLQRQVRAMNQRLDVTLANFE